MSVSERELEAWSMLADAEAARVRLGEINWAMIVRALVAEVRRLRCT